MTYISRLQAGLYKDEGTFSMEHLVIKPHIRTDVTDFGFQTMKFHFFFSHNMTKFQISQIRNETDIP